MSPFLSILPVKRPFRADPYTFVSERTIDSHVKRIRRKFRERGGAFIETVHGLGYRFRSCEEAA